MKHHRCHGERGGTSAYVIWGKKRNSEFIPVPGAEWGGRKTTNKLPFSDVFLQTQNNKSQHDFYGQQNSSLNQNTDAGRRRSGPVSPTGSSGRRRGRLTQHAVANASFSQHNADSQTNEERSLTTFPAWNPSEGTHVFEYSNKSCQSGPLNKENNSWQRKRNQFILYCM